MFETFLREFKVRENLAQLSGGERMLTNLSQLEELLQTLCSRSRLTPEALIEEFSGLICQSRERSGSDEEHEELMASGGSSVKILTVHASKGLQYPVVMLPQLDKLAVPKILTSELLYYDGECRKLDLLRKPECQRVIKDEIFDELLRLIYVAITRAEYRCEIFGGEPEDGTPLAWLLKCRKDSNEVLPILPREFSTEEYVLPSPDEFVGEVAFIPDFSVNWQVVSYTFLTRGVSARGNDLPADHDENLPALQAGENERVSGFSPQFRWRWFWCWRFGLELLRSNMHMQPYNGCDIRRLGK